MRNTTHQKNGVKSMMSQRVVMSLGLAWPLLKTLEDRRPGMRGPEVVSVVPKSPAAEQGVPHFDEGWFVFFKFYIGLVGFGGVS